MNILQSLDLPANQPAIPMNVSTPADLKAKLLQLSRERGVSLSRLVVAILREATR